MKSKINPLSRKDNLVVQELEGEVLIYDLSENKAYCLNETSALVWESCDGTKSATEISKIISKKLSSSANEDLVWFAIDQLKKEGLIENGELLHNNFAGMSRREVIKKVGLGTMIALPVVASLVAPTAALAGFSACGTMCQCDMLGAGPGGNYTLGDLCMTTIACPTGTTPSCNVCVSSGNSAGSLMDNCFYG